MRKVSAPALAGLSASVRALIGPTPTEEAPTTPEAQPRGELRLATPGRTNRRAPFCKCCQLCAMICNLCNPPEVLESQQQYNLKQIRAISCCASARAPRRQCHRTASSHKLSWFQNIVEQLALHRFGESIGDQACANRLACFDPLIHPGHCVRACGGAIQYPGNPPQQQRRCAHGPAVHRAGSADFRPGF